MSRSIVRPTIISVIAIYAIVSSVKSRSRYETVLKSLIEKNDAVSASAKRLFYQSLKQDDDLLAATIIWIDYHEKTDYLSRLIGKDTSGISEVRYDSKDLKMLSKSMDNKYVPHGSFKTTDDHTIRHEALRIVSRYLPAARLDIVDVTPASCLVSYI